MTQEEMHEWREEMRMDAYQDEMHERQMRTDDDYWWDEVITLAETETFAETLNTLASMCDMYDRCYADERNALIDYY